MRDLINIVSEAHGMGIPTPRQLAGAIEELVKSYIEDGDAPNAFEINNGRCEDFSEEIVAHFVQEETDDFMTIDAANLSVEGFGDEWDVDLITRMWPSCQPTHGLTWEDVLYEVPRHAWIVLHKRHYDAECPQGVDNFFDLPLLQKGMTYIASKKPRGQ